MKNLVIVESPNKVETIKKYLGSDFEVIASVGHFLDMTTEGKDGLGIDFELWEPKMKLSRGKSALVKSIKAAVKNADIVYIATDPDREGEAIGNNLVEYFKIEKYARIKYNEITKEAILNAIKNPTMLNLSLVQAQKTRRMIDRVIGFKLSKFLKNKIKNAPGSLSAGRVQSVALKLVIDRENEIREFIPEKYFKLNAKIHNNELLAYYYNAKNESDKKDWIFTNEIEKIKEYFDKAKKELTVKDIKVSQRKVAAITPFKQSTLYKRSPYSASKTQVIIQKLYEGFGEGGLISYPRTDSTRLSETFIKEAKDFVLKKWGQEYISDEIKGFSGDQDAHEAIRPTDIYLHPEIAKTKFPLTEEQYKVYKLIYETTLQAVIKQPIRESKAYDFVNGDYIFKQSFSRIIFDGYYVVTGKEAEFNDPGYEINQVVNVENFNFEELETKPVPRYNDGTLIEKLDEIKVGRPSTFATTVKILKERNYVTMEGKQIVPNEFGYKVLESLIKPFPQIINETYTSSVEERLDLIAEAQAQKNEVMQAFWTRFEDLYNNTSETVETYTYELKHLDENCPECSSQLLIRNSKKGVQFIACSGFPKCRYTRSLPENEKQENKATDEEETSENSFDF
ncbi:type I DNA topoisomerase [Mycoplasma leonicaptivi]|uniref:type I DNA topoisomerase n=1 Tax=Mycoplasma leonicaptivi TaxID=36742 RepID=UPI00047F70B0|nr:type I DNA topoisomerase [Mycoplasma leonicaptivi]